MKTTTIMLLLALGAAPASPWKRQPATAGDLAHQLTEALAKAHHDAIAVQDPADPS